MLLSPSIFLVHVGQQLGGYCLLTRRASLPHTYAGTLWKNTITDTTGSHALPVLEALLPQVQLTPTNSQSHLLFSTFFSLSNKL